MALLVLFASLSSRRRFKSSSDKVANLDFDSAMTQLIKLLVSVLGYVCMHKTIVCRYDVTFTFVKSIVCRYDVRETEQPRISCVLIANQNQACYTNV